MRMIRMTTGRGRDVIIDADDLTTRILEEIHREAARSVADGSITSIDGAAVAAELEWRRVMGVDARRHIDEAAARRHARAVGNAGGYTTWLRSGDPLAAVEQDVLGV